jgi:hypothetical protein
VLLRKSRKRKRKRKGKKPARPATYTKTHSEMHILDNYQHARTQPHTNEHIHAYLPYLPA